MDIEKLTLGEAKKKLQEYKELAAAMNRPIEENDSDFWKIGKNYFIRTVTHHHTGRLTAVNATELVLEQAAWIADDGRLHEALQKEEFDEVEPFPDRPVLVGRGAIIDAVEIESLPRDVK